MDSDTCANDTQILVDNDTSGNDTRILLDSDTAGDGIQEVARTVQPADMPSNQEPELSATCSVCTPPSPQDSLDRPQHP